MNTYESNRLVIGYTLSGVYVITIKHAWKYDSAGFYTAVKGELNSLDTDSQRAAQLNSMLNDGFTVLEDLLRQHGGDNKTALLDMQLDRLGSTGDKLLKRWFDTQKLDVYRVDLEKLKFNIGVSAAENKVNRFSLTDSFRTQDTSLSSLDIEEWADFVEAAVYSNKRFVEIDLLPYEDEHANGIRLFLNFDGSLCETMPKKMIWDSKLLTYYPESE